MSMDGELSRRFQCRSADGDHTGSSEGFHASTLDTDASSFVCFAEDSRHGEHEVNASSPRGGGQRRLNGSFGSSASRPRRQEHEDREGDSPVLVGDDARRLKADIDAMTRALPVSSGKGGQRFETVLVIQMELCSGSSLRSWLSSGQRSGVPLDFVIGRKGEALELAFAKQLMKGIREIHNADMVHRDLKPQNVFVTNEQVLKIGDFGLAKHACDQRKSEGDIGTPAYAAPEGGAQAKAPADVFSAALVVLELLCPPFPTAMEHAQVLEALRAHATLPEHITEGVPMHAALLRRMAQRSPGDRPTAEEAYLELKRLGCTVPPGLKAASST